MGPKSVQNQFRDHLRFRGRFWFGSDAILDPTWAHLGGQVGAMLRPCWPTNRFLEVLEGAQKRQGNLILVWTVSGPILGRFGEAKWSQNRSKIGLKSDHEVNAKIFKNHWFWSRLWRSRGSKIDQKSTKNRFSNDLKMRCESNTQKCRKKGLTWLQKWV